MIKNVLIESIRGYILKKKPDQDSLKRVSPQRIEKALSQAYDNILVATYKNDDLAFEASYVKDYYNRAVNTSNGVKYVTIPDKFVAIPKGGGIWYVRPNGGGSNLPYYTEVAQAIFGSLPSGEKARVINYKVGTVPNVLNRVIVLSSQNSGLRSGLRAIDFGVARSFESFASTEDVIVPDGMYTDLVQATLAIMGERPADNVNNDQ